MSEWFEKLSYYYYSMVYKFSCMNEYMRSLFAPATNVFGLSVKKQDQGYTMIGTEDYSSARYLSYDDLWEIDDIEPLTNTRKSKFEDL